MHESYLITRALFKGIELAWEFPGQRGGDSVNDKKNFPILLAELHQALKENGKILSIIVAISVGYDVPKIVQHVDYVILYAQEYFDSQKTGLKIFLLTNY